MEERKRIVRNHYEPLLDKYSRGHEILDWESQESQIKRFEVLSDNVELSGKKLLDVGCGTGDLFGFLISQGMAAAEAARQVGVVEQTYYRWRKEYGGMQISQ